MKTVSVVYQATYYQEFEVPDNWDHKQIMELAWDEMGNIDFQDGSVVWEPSMLEVDGEEEDTY